MKTAKVLSLVVVLGIASLATAGDFDYGKPEEMRGLTRFYVDTGADLRAHDEIVNRIGKGLPTLALVDKPEAAELILVFGQRTEEYAAKVNNMGGIEYDSADKGDGYVFRVADGRLRLVFTDRPTREYFFERSAGKKFADGFIVAYRKANR